MFMPHPWAKYLFRCGKRSGPSHDLNIENVENCPKQIIEHFLGCGRPSAGSVRSTRGAPYRVFMAFFQICLYKCHLARRFQKMRAMIGGRAQTDTIGFFDPQECPVTKTQS